MPLLSQQDAEYIRQDFEKTLVHPVRLHVFTQDFECMYCRETRQICEEVAALSDKVEVVVHDFVESQDIAEKFGVDKIPAIVVTRVKEDGSEEDYGIRFFGIPSGYEFMSLLEAIKLVSTGKLSLSPATLEQIKTLDRPVHIQVFITPTCPYCPRAVMLSHQLAFASPLIRADMIEATEFPHLAMRYQVMGVPRSVINEDIHIEGAVPEPMFVRELMKVKKLPVPA